MDKDEPRPEPSAGKLLPTEDPSPLTSPLARDDVFTPAEPQHASLPALLHQSRRGMSPRLVASASFAVIRVPESSSGAQDQAISAPRS